MALSAQIQCLAIHTNVTTDIGHFELHILGESFLSMVCAMLKFHTRAKLGHNHAMLIRLLLLLLLTTSGLANETNPIFSAAERHARDLAKGQGKHLIVEAGPLDTTRLAPCSRLEPYTPPNTRTLGQTYIGVRCITPANWNILVPVRIGVLGHYLASTRSLSAGQTLQPTDISLMSGDLGSLPQGTIDHPDKAIGKILRNPIGAGQPLRSTQLTAPQLIQRGQTVQVIAGGEGFSVQAEGKAMNNAAEGDIARVKMQSGRTISGVVQPDGTILIDN